MAWALRLPPGTRARSLRTLLFMCAVVLVNYTLSRPSPVDIALFLAFLLTPLCYQSITTGALSYLMLVFFWTTGLLISSWPYLDDPEVTYQLSKIGYAVLISICSCLVAVHWTPRLLRKFLNVWILSGCIAASLGIFGFLTENPDLTWDGRAKGFLDDPNMYGAFLLPALLSCIYFLHGTRHRLIYGIAFGILCVGLAFSFSRVAVTVFVGLGAVTYLGVNARRPARATLMLVFLAGSLAIAGAVAIAALPRLAEKVTDRATLAKDYDLGNQGRLSRYVKSFDMMLENPHGLGAMQFEKLFPEPIHNIWLSSFVNYGWISGFAWTLIAMFSVVLSVRKYRQTGNPLVLVIFVCWLSIFLCALLHEAERWRHLWLFTGLLWGLNAKMLQHEARSRAAAAVLPRATRPGWVEPTRLPDPARS